MDHEKIDIDDATRKYIIDELVEPYYKKTVANTIRGKTCWRKTGITFETLSKVMVALGSIMSFSAGYYHDDTLSFISGSISCLSLTCLQFSSFSYKENKKQGDELNVLLKKLKLDTVPALARDEYNSPRAQTHSYSPDPFRPRATSQDWAQTQAQAQANDNQRRREEAFREEIEKLNKDRVDLLAELDEINKIHQPALKSLLNQGDNNSLRSADAAAAHQAAYQALQAGQYVDVNAV